MIHMKMKNVKQKHDCQNARKRAAQLIKTRQNMNGPFVIL